MHFVEQKYRQIMEMRRAKTKWNRKWKIPHTGLEKQALCFSFFLRTKSFIVTFKKIFDIALLNNIFLSFLNLFISFIELKNH